MSNLMSKFRKKVTVNIVDIFRLHIRRERGVNVVCHRAARSVSHVLLTVFLRHPDDIEVRRKSVDLFESKARGFFRNAVPSYCCMARETPTRKADFRKN